MSGSFDEKKFKEEIQDSALALLLTDVAANPNRKHIKAYVPPSGGSVRDQFKFAYNTIYLNPYENGLDPALASNKIFSFKNKKEDLEKFNFLQMENIEIASLYPQIRIYKIVKLNDKLIEIEIPFEDYTSKDALNYIFALKDSRGSGVGLRSFEWKSLARNEASLAQFSAKLQFHVQDVGELERTRNSSEGVNVTLMDLLYPTLREATLEQNSKFNKNTLTIKAVVGWNSDDANATKKQVLEKYGQQTFWLTLSNHDFQFNEDGSIDVSIDYYARSELDSFDENDADIFGEIKRYKQAVETIKSAFNKAIKKLQKDATEEDRKKTLKEFESIVRPFTGETSKAFLKDLDPLGETLGANPYVFWIEEFPDIDDAEGLKRIYEKWKNDQKDTIERSRNILLRRVLRNFSKNNRIYNIKLDSFQIEKLKQIYSYGNNSYVDLEDAEELSKSLRILKNRNNSKQNSNLNNYNNEEMLSKLDEANPSDTTTEEYSSGIFASLQASFKELSIFSNEVDAEKIEVVPYLYVYDIINYFYNSSPINISAGQKQKVVLGSISCKDLNFRSSDRGELKKKKLKLDDEEESTVKAIPLQNKIINIGDIPISLKSFINWLSNEIITKDFSNISFGTFLNKLFTGLIYKNYNIRFLKFFPSYAFKLNMKRATLNSDFKAISSTNHIYSEKTFYNIREYATNFKDIKKRQDYLFILPESEKPKGRKGDYEDDFYNNNIHHFYVGEEKGLLRNVKFSREDMPRLETVNVGKANEAGNLGFIRHPYRAQVRLFGNTVFDVGNMIYISPTYPGTGIRNSSFHRIGLSGYYVVHAVDSYIEMGEYRTELNCLWQSYAESKNNNQPPSISEDTIPEDAFVQVE